MKVWPNSWQGGTHPLNFLFLGLRQIEPGKSSPLGLLDDSDLTGLCLGMGRKRQRRKRSPLTAGPQAWGRIPVAGRPGSQAPFYSCSPPRIRSDLPHQDLIPSDDQASPFLPPATTQGDPAPCSSPWSSTALSATPVKARQTSVSAVKREPPPPGRFTPQPLPSHLQPISDPLPGPNMAFRGAPPTSCTCPPVERTA